MKTCNRNDCELPCFSKGLCLKHWREEHGKPLSKHKNPSHRYKPVNKVAKKRSKQLMDYKKITLDSGTPMRCFFCDKPIVNGQYDKHHLKGRENDLLLEKEWLVPAHNNCHVHLYHSVSVKKLMLLPWYEGFLLRLKAKSEELWQKEIDKQSK